MEIVVRQVSNGKPSAKVPTKVPSSAGCRWWCRQKTDERARKGTIFESRKVLTYLELWRKSLFHNGLRRIADNRSLQSLNPWVVGSSPTGGIA